MEFNAYNFSLVLEELSKLREQVSCLVIENQQLKAENQQLKAENQELRLRLSLDSHNSSKPPSSDGLQKKPVNLRKSSGKRVGGQPGHKGSTLQYQGRVDKTVYHMPQIGCLCGLEYLQSKQSTTYVIDLPVVQSEVTQHKCLEYHCSKCGKVYSSKLFKGNQVQYGKTIKSLAIYLKDYHFISYQRLSELFKDCFDLSISQGTLANFTGEAYQNLSGFERSLKGTLLKSPVLHVDETGMRGQGKTQWMHVASTNDHTLYHFDAQRGRAAMDRAGLLPIYQGTLIHERFSAYFHYGKNHALCNAHLLRDLIRVEQQGHTWAKKIKGLLLHAKTKKQKEPLTKAFITRTTNTFKKIVRGELAKYSKAKDKSCRGRPKRTQAQNLLLALNKYNRDLLRFLKEPHIAFDNNLAERDIRMVKTKQKISGCFRGRGGEYFARIRSYTSTIKKQNRDMLEAIKLIFEPEKTLEIYAE